MKLRRNMLPVEGMEEKQRILYRHQGIRLCMPDKSRRRVFTDLIFKRHFIHQFFIIFVQQIFKGLSVRPFPGSNDRIG